ncbi:hypothetical protein [Brevundimonas sp.]|uniref:hypothetical protein n=1 Tax=Brevundimonas sp. TaxID=1871086 RepID=UPI00391D08AC
MGKRTAEAAGAAVEATGAIVPLAVAAAVAVAVAAAVAAAAAAAAVVVVVVAAEVVSVPQAARKAGQDPVALAPA